MWGKCCLSVCLSLSLLLPFSCSPFLSAALTLDGDSLPLEVRKGQFLRMLCEADSRPPATLSWALEDRVLSWSHLPSSGGLEVVLPGVKPEDAGRYTCRGENRLGFQSRTLNLSVQCECDQQGLVSRRREGEVQGLGAGSQSSKEPGTQAYRTMILIPISDQDNFPPDTKQFSDTS